MKTIVKTKLLLFAAILCASVHSYATTYTVTLSGMVFTPSTITVHPGDVINWVWVNGTHTTTSVTIPGGATMWDQNINSGSTSFSYTPTVIGTYHYQCNFHVTMGMVGVINVVSATGIEPVNTAAYLFNMYPNPVSGSLHLQFADQSTPLSVILTDMAGKEVMRNGYATAKETDINLADVSSGPYIVRVEQGGKVSKQEVMIAH